MGTTVSAVDEALQGELLADQALFHDDPAASAGLLLDHLPTVGDGLVLGVQVDAHDLDALAAGEAVGFQGEVFAGGR